MSEAIELGRQDHVGDQDAEAESEEKPVERLAKQARVPGHAQAHPGRKGSRRHPFDFRQYGFLRSTACEVGIDRNGPLPVETGDDRRRLANLDFGDLGEGDQPALVPPIRAEEDVLKICGVPALLALGADSDVEPVTLARKLRLGIEASPAAYTK